MRGWRGSCVDSGVLLKFVGSICFLLVMVGFVPLLEVSIIIR